jgi:rubrerythrin
MKKQHFDWEERIEELEKLVAPENDTGSWAKGWVCPKCGYVWAWWVSGCGNCNQPKVCTVSTKREKGGRP